MHPLWGTAIIYTVSLVCLLLVRPGAWRALLRYPALWLLALAAGLTNVSFNWAVTEGDVVRVVLLFYMMPLWAALLAWPLLDERPTPSTVARMFLAFAGVVVVLKTPGSEWPVPSGRSDWLALAGGFTFALTNVLLRRLRAVAGEARVTAMFCGGMLLAGAGALVGMGHGSVAAPPALQTGWVLVVVVLSLAFLVANIGLQFGASRLSAHATSVTMLSEVVFASSSAVLLGAAVMGPRTWIGGGLIFLASLWSALAPGPKH